MIFDFAALLVLLTLVSGGIWAADAWFIAPRRARGGSGQGAEPPLPIVVEYAKSFFPVFLVVLMLRSFIVEPFRIPSASMMPTLLEGDFILVNKYDYGIRLPVLNLKVIERGFPQRGDIVVFRYPENPSIPYIKRIIGLPGDVVEYRDKHVYINGEEMRQEQAGAGAAPVPGIFGDGPSHRVEGRGAMSHDILVDPRRSGPESRWAIPDGHYFVMGDNRDNSRDSREWGLVPDGNLIGRAFFIWMNWSFNRKNGGIAWNRIGTILH